jgi:hypothetical protein
MNKCIFCGTEVEWIYAPNDHICLIPIKIQCLQCGLEWTKAEHKDNQNWNVRHTRALEAQVAELQRLLAELTIIVENHLKE